MKNLDTCYRGHDLQAQMALQLENLKITANKLALTLTNATFAPECQTFKDIYFEGKKGNTVALVTCFAMLVGIVVLVLLGVYLYRFRMFDRIMAKIAKKPYGGMSQNDQERNLSEMKWFF